jgi:hypothetical protein
MPHVWRTHGPSPKETKITLVFSCFIAALSILLVGKKYSTVATQGFFGKAELPTS